MTEQERKKALEDVKKQMKELKASIKELSNIMEDQPKLYSKAQFKEEIKYLSTLIDVKYLLQIEKESDLTIRGRMSLDMFIKQLDDGRQLHKNCNIGLSLDNMSYYRKEFRIIPTQTATEFCNRYSATYDTVPKDQHQGILGTLGDRYGINMVAAYELSFGLTKQQAQHIINIMEKYENAPEAKIMIMKYVLDNFNEIDQRLGINITADQIKTALTETLKTTERIHNKNLKNNVYCN